MGTASRLTIEENMAIALRRGQKRGLGWGVKEKDRIQFQEALKELNIGLENRLKVDTQYLSGGQRQALTLVMAALVKPKLLLLDEHTAALDPKTSQIGDGFDAKNCGTPSVDDFDDYPRYEPCD